MLESLFGGLLGGLFRLAPEVLKLLDRKSERLHELALLKAEMEFAKVRGEIMMRQTEAVMTVAELDAVGKGVEEQGRTARAAGKTIAAISALVRPVVTYAFVTTYFLVKLAAYLLALEQGGDWRIVLLDMWNKDDMAMLSMIISFWFISRTLHHMNNGKG
jgi:hypothetical protein